VCSILHYCRSERKKEQQSFFFVFFLSFGKCYTCFGYETNTRLVCILAIFQHKPMFGHINGGGSSRRDQVKIIGILKNNQNTYHPRFGLTPKTGIAFPKTGFCFYCISGALASIALILFLSTLVWEQAGCVIRLMLTIFFCFPSL